MAYGNWGAFVYRDGQRRRDCEDAKGWAYHAVLGDGPIRLCCYKVYPELLVLRDGIMARMAIPWDPWELGGAREAAGEVYGYRWSATYAEPASVVLTLTELDGATWRARCGSGIGAGHEPDPDLPNDARKMPP